MFTDKAQTIVDLAKDFAHTTGAEGIEPNVAGDGHEPAHRGRHSPGGVCGHAPGKAPVCTPCHC